MQVLAWVAAVVVVWLELVVEESVMVLVLQAVVPVVEPLAAALPVVVATCSHPIRRGCGHYVQEGYMVPQCGYNLCPVSR